MCVAGADATSAKAIQDGGRIDTQVYADPCERPAEGVEVDGSIDLIDGEAATTHRRAVPTENGAHSPPSDAEPIAQLIHRRPARYPAMSSWTWSASNWRARCGLGRSIGGGAGSVGSGSFRSSVSRASTLGFVL